MNTQKAIKEFRMSQWEKIMQSRIDSGLSIKDFCRTNGISRNAYFYWQKKLREAACTSLEEVEETKNIVPDGWMQLTPKRECTTKGTLGIGLIETLKNKKADGTLIDNYKYTYDNAGNQLTKQEYINKIGQQK